MKRTRELVWLVLAIGLSGIVVPSPARSQERAFNTWEPLSAAQLDALRGGFVMPSGLELSLGIQRVAYVNGQLVASSSVNIPNITNLSPQDTEALAQLAQTTVVQIGQNNSFEQPAGLNGLVIQNTLDGQHIVTMTTVDVGVNTLGMFQSLNLGNALQDALNGAPAP